MKLLLVLFLAACGDSTTAPGSATSLGGPVAATPPSAEPKTPAVPPAEAPTEAAAPIAAAAPVAAPTSLSVHDLSGMNKADLRVARNTIFARHGRAFSSADLQAHFAAQEWYQVNPNYSDDLLTDAQKAQVALIASFESDRNPMDQYQFAGEPTLSFADAQTVIIGDFAAVYEGTAPTYSYSVHGDWVRTWDGGFPMTADASDVAWYELNYDDGSVKRRVQASDLTH